MSTIAITGNTYPVKDRIKALGGRWNADLKAWMVPADKAAEAQRLVSGAGPTRGRVPQIERRPGGSMYRNGQSYWHRGVFVLGDDD